MRKSEKIASSLDTIETKKHFPDSYRDRLLEDSRDEYEATSELYTTIDRDFHKNHSEQLNNCRTFAFFIINKESRKVKVAANACRLRWCPICAKAKSITVSNSIMDYLKYKKEAKFLTLTLKHSEAPLKHQIDHLYGAFKEFRRLKIFKKNCKGGIWFFQIKKSRKDNLWHPHLHCILDSAFISQNELSQSWLRITKSSSIVDIRKIYNVEKIANYVARYAARPSNLAELEPDERLELFQTMHRRRLCGKWGDITGVDLSGQHRPNSDDTIKSCRFETATKKRCIIKPLGILVACWESGEPIPLEYELSYFSNPDFNTNEFLEFELIVDEVFNAT